MSENIYNTFGKGSSNRAINGGNDEYFTSERVAYLCCYLMSKHIPNLRNRFLIEPSAGGGVFIKAVSYFGCKNVVGYDICPKSKNVEKDDFLKLEIPEGCVVFGNPPFGFSGNLAVKFFNRAAEKASYIAFILPKSFQKESIKDRLSLKYILHFEEELTQKSFILDGNEYSVPCVFQIWKKTKNERVLSNKKEELKKLNKYLSFVKEQRDSDFCIRRVGSRAGMIIDGDNLSPSSTYFCVGNYQRIKNIIDEIDFSSIVIKTSGVKSLSKIELLREIERKLNEDKLC